MPLQKRLQPARKTGKAAVSVSGPLPPYGIAIRQAIARGDLQEMKKVAQSARRYRNAVQSALDKLDKALSQKRH